MLSIVFWWFCASYTCLHKTLMLHFCALLCYFIVQLLHINTSFRVYNWIIVKPCYSYLMCNILCTPFIFIYILKRVMLLSIILLGTEIFEILQQVCGCLPMAELKWRSQFFFFIFWSQVFFPEGARTPALLPTFCCLLTGIACLHIYSQCV